MPSPLGMGPYTLAQPVPVPYPGAQQPAVPLPPQQGTPQGGLLGNSTITPGINAIAGSVQPLPQINPANVPQITPPSPFNIPTISAPAPTAGVPQGFTPTAGQVNPSQIPSINAPQIQASQAGFNDFNALQQAIYESTYGPISQEIAHQQELQNQALASQLARQGLSSSGVATGATIKLNNEFTRQFVDQSRNAANQAAAQRYGLEYAQSLDNAKLQQEANLANAGFSLQSQIATSSNVMQALLQNAQLGTQASIAGANNLSQASGLGAQLGTQASIAGSQQALDASQGNAQLSTSTQLALRTLEQQGQLANVDNYFKALGLNLQSGVAGMQQFLDLLGLQEQDLQRLDQYDLQTLSIFATLYLGDLATIGNVGQTSQGRSETPTG